MTTRVQARIAGRVQGVGFRPTVYRYATALGLAGFVRNDPHGVTLEVEGETAAVERFFRQLESQPPRQAVVTGIEKLSVSPRGEQSFLVIESEPAGSAQVHGSPDLCTCDDCLRELADPADRRHRYPFINCTNCGPRFSILRTLPYDRPNTSMSGFTMCPACDREYHDPADRRFHAQPAACPACGPALRLVVVDHAGRVEPPARPPGTDAEALESAVALLRAGKIVALKSLGGFHLACTLAASPALRARKSRPHKPLAVMFRDVEIIRRFCHLGEAEEAELLSPARPIVILRLRTPAAHQAGDPARQQLAAASPDFPSIGALLPYTPLHQLLLESFDALVMTSGNLAEEPISSEDAELPGGIADAVLTHDRPIAHKCDDSVVRVLNGQRQFIRRARGFVPSPIRIAPAGPHILAVGGELKNTFCLARDGWAFVSQHIGDLKELRTIEYFERELAEWQRLMRVSPVAIAHDLHPAYLSTKWAQNQHALKSQSSALKSQISDLKSFFGVQHHHAHIASVLAEHQLDGPVIGVALDGTGFGPDGTIWGGEFLVATRAGYERLAHFKQYRLPGGEKAIEQPWRMAASVLHGEHLGGLGSRERQLEPLLASGFNSPLSSSAGRLFDAVSALLGLCDTISYEGQAAIRLEAAADPRVQDSYAFDLHTNARPWQLDFGRSIRLLLEERGHGENFEVLAAKFHNTVTAAILLVCQLLGMERNLKAVALSGGVFQNELLLRRTMEALQAHGFEVFTNVAVPPNDGGLALGQAAVAAARLQRDEEGRVKREEGEVREAGGNQPCA